MKKLALILGLLLAACQVKAQIAPAGNVCTASGNFSILTTISCTPSNPISANDLIVVAIGQKCHRTQSFQHCGNAASGDYFQGSNPWAGIGGPHLTSSPVQNWANGAGYAGIDPSQEYGIFFWWTCASKSGSTSFTANTTADGTVDVGINMIVADFNGNDPTTPNACQNNQSAPPIPGLTNPDVNFFSAGGPSNSQNSPQVPNAVALRTNPVRRWVWVFSAEYDRGDDVSPGHTWTVVGQPNPMPTTIAQVTADQQSLIAVYGLVSDRSITAPPYGFTYTIAGGGTSGTWANGILAFDVTQKFVERKKIEIF